VIRASTDDTVANLRALQPVLTKLNEAGDSLPASLELLLTYPFPDQALAAMKGDYTNLHLSLDLDLRSLLGLTGLDAGGLGLPALPGVSGLPDLATVPGPADLPGVGGLALPKAGEQKVPAPGSAGLPTSGPTLPALPSLPGLTGLTDLTGLTGPSSPASTGQAPVLDPGLMGLLLGGLAAPAPLAGGAGAQR
jgi:phospholipid/cholesterol/gamma-HCH transport system substrate-binding protein